MRITKGKNKRNIGKYTLGRNRITVKQQSTSGNSSNNRKEKKLQTETGDEYPYENAV